MRTSVLCPFCGGKAKMDEDMGQRFWFSCQKCCACSGPAWDKKSAKQKWEQRKGEANC
jgi:hypothetical protein